MTTTSNSQLSFFAGPDAAPFALDLYRNMSERARRSILWDVQKEDRKMRLLSSVRMSALAAVYYQGFISGPSAMCWLGQIGINAKVAACHFAFADAPALGSHDKLKIASDFLLACKEHFDFLLGLLPASFVGQQKFVLALGFEKLKTIPNACFIASHNRLTSGALYGRLL